MDENTVSATLKEIDCIIVRWIETHTTQIASLQHCYRRFMIDDVNQSSDILQHSQNRPTGDRWLKF